MKNETFLSLWIFAPSQKFIFATEKQEHNITATTAEHNEIRSNKNKMFHLLLNKY